MRWLWWSQLPLLIIIQLLGPTRLNQKVHVEALLSFKSTISSRQQLGNLAGQSPCSRTRIGVSCSHKLKGVTTSSSLHGTRPPCSKSEPIKPSPCTPTSFPSQRVISIQANLYKSRKTRARVGGDLGFTTWTPSSNNVKKQKEPKVAAIVIGCAGAVLLVAIVVVVVYVCLMLAKRSVRRTSDTVSSAPSQEWPRENGFPYAGAASPYETQNVRQLSLLELEHATSKFSPGNVIGEGGFGLVYKGLLQDGSIVAIKQRFHDPSHYFVREVENIGGIHHRHLAKLIGFCQESHQQLLVYDYLPNGNVGNHLYDSEGLPVGKLDIRQRLSIALGAAKGLEYLHCLTPPSIHMHFRTRNVLVDENFVAKVSDFGLSKLIDECNRAESSSSSIDCFLDPELRSSNAFSIQSDVYSFGVFLLELISGREALDRSESELQKNIVVEAKSMSSIVDFVDKTMGERSMDTMQLMTSLALHCVDTGEKRPVMKTVVGELEIIVERERGIQGTDLGEEIGIVTLGSELFK